MNESEITKTIKSMGKRKELCETRWVQLDQDFDPNHIWAVVFGWCGGFDNGVEKGQYTQGDYCLCGKIAYKDGSMGEYDYDWIMPYDDDNGVWDSETSISCDADIASSINWWKSEWEEIKKWCSKGIFNIIVDSEYEEYIAGNYSEDEWLDNGGYCFEIERTTKFNPDTVQTANITFEELENFANVSLKSKDTKKLKAIVKDMISCGFMDKNYF